MNARIDRLTAASLADYQRARPEQIGMRIAELDREWDIDRALMLNFAIAGGTAASLALRTASRNRGRLRGNRWAYLLGVQLGFLALHALVGWCPPVALWRRFGFRTSKEIQRERAALEAMLSEKRSETANV